MVMEGAEERGEAGGWLHLQELSEGLGELKHHQEVREGSGRQFQPGQFPERRERDGVADQQVLSRSFQLLGSLQVKSVLVQSAVSVILLGHRSQGSLATK